MEELPVVHDGDIEEQTDHNHVGDKSIHDLQRQTIVCNLNKSGKEIKCQSTIFTILGGNNFFV